MRHARQQRIDAAVEQIRTQARACDVPGCTAVGEFRAPKDRKRLDDYYMFCLDHVRIYNRAWDYYAGMSADEIEWNIQQDLQWRRPLWPLGGRHGTRQRFDDARVRDHFGFFDESGEGTGDSYRRHESSGARNGRRTPEEEALGVLDLDAGASPDHIKARYKELAKRLHPDANGGDREAEEKLKLVNQAYATLKNGGGPR